MAASQRDAESAHAVSEREELSEEVARLKRELRAAQEEIGKLQRTSVSVRQDAEEGRGRLERAVEAQRRELEAHEEMIGRARTRADEAEARARRQNEAMFALMVDTVHMLFYLTDLLSAMQALFYDPTPFVKLGGGSRVRSASASSVRGGPQPLLSLSGGGYSG